MTFILRTVLPDGHTTNTIIGEDYSFVNKETQRTEFEQAYKVVFGLDLDELEKEVDQFAKNCYGILNFKNGSGIIPLYKRQNYYIMTDNGCTFENLTFK